MYRKEVTYDRNTRDYAMYLDGELVGFGRTYHEAEVKLDQLVFELISDGATATATELDGGAVEMPEGDWLDTDGMRVPPPDSLRQDCLNVITMALGQTTGASSIVSELRRVKARLEQAAAA